MARGSPLGHLQEVTGKRLRAVDVAQSDEHLAHADERARLACSVSQVATKLEALLERDEGAGVVTGVVDEEPTQRVECGGELHSIAELAPELDPLREESTPCRGIAAPRR